MQKLAILYTMAGCAFYASHMTDCKVLPGTQELVEELADQIKEKAVANGETTWAKLNELVGTVPPAFRDFTGPEDKLTW